MKRFPKTIGITGGIGSGKSFICHILRIIGYPVFYADKAAKEVYFDPLVKEKVIELLGPEAYSSDCEINREFISRQVFNNATLLSQLNAIIHPEVRNTWKNWVTKQDSELVFQEAAILFETGGYKNFDFTILVTADESTRIERVVRRDQISKDAVIARMEKQWPDNEKKKLCDFIIVNNDCDMLLPQINAVLNEILK